MYQSKYIRVWFDMVHLNHDVIILASYTVAHGFDRIFFGIWQGCCDHRRFSPTQLQCIFIKILFCSCLDTKYARTGLDYIEIPAENGLFTPKSLYHEGKIDFEAFSDKIAALP